MAKEMEKEMMETTEMNGKETGSVKVVETSKDAIMISNPFSNFEAHESDDVDGGAGSVKRYKTDIPVVRRQNRGKDGELYWNYAIGYALNVRGKVLEQQVFLIPERRKAVFELLDMIFGGENVHPLEIIRTEYTRNNEKTVRYSMQVSYMDESGVEISCGLNSSKGADRLMFDNLINLLKVKKVIE